MARILSFPLRRRGVTFRGWLVRQRDHATARGHRRCAERFREALAALDAGSIAGAVRLVPRHRSIAEALAAEALAVRRERRARTRRPRSAA